jgi:hypothetical protein
VANKYNPWFPDEKIYTDVRNFIPERWYAKPEMIKESGAFAPFSAGMFTVLLLHYSKISN